MSYVPQIHQTAPLAYAKNMYGTRYYCNFFPYFLTDKERYNPLDYFRMGIIKEIRFFFLDMEDPARNQKLCVK